MSFQVTFSGHSNATHTPAVVKAIDAVVEELNKVEGLTGSVGGYSWDSGAEKVEFSRTLQGPVKPPEVPMGG